MDHTFIQQISIIFGIVASAVAIIATMYGIKKKRELTRSQLRTEKTKRSAYQSKKKAEEMRKAESFSKVIKNFLDMFRGK